MAGSRRPSANGSVKREYLGPDDAEAKAHEYLTGATTTTEVAGRALALVARTLHADESAVAQSQRSFFGLRFTTYGGKGLPWTGEARELLDEILIEKLPAAVAEPIRVARDERAAQREEEERRDRERDGIAATFVEQAPTMAREDREAEIQRLCREYGYTAIPRDVGAQLMELPEPAAEDDASS